METLKKWTLLSLGSLCVALAVLGIFIPLLPTTPFLLLAAACYFRSSDRLYGWLVGHRLFGPFIRDFQEKQGMTVRSKVLAIGLMWLGIGYAATLTELWISLGLLVVALGVTVYLLRLKTL
ncbi:YbaN family protein [Candidatus Cyanaurora vandensis]|uniref:YbaN family protein n=1 Tax=Candidatus Cyanaurora vandensis TaxID=2714958 RepID=UPI00257F4A59|nr:YbaN family protein [Candidatus Cyanaurora vandensis]